MRLSMVGHAAVLLDTGPVRLLTDPWLQGLAFAESWATHPQPVLPDAQRDGLTHLWISHEHPDHLSIPTLKALPAELRARLTVLTQRHVSDHVVGFLNGQGFASVVELSHGAWCELPGGLRVMSHQVGHEDSAMTFADGRHTVFNLNDCKPDPGSLRRMLAQIGPVDVLLDQFSVAGWTGNPEDEQDRAAHHDEALSSLVSQVELVQPRHLVPFASFMRFAHEENAHHNLAGVTLDEVAQHVAPERLVVLLPGDSWDLDAPPPPFGPALARAREHVAQIPGLPLHRSAPVSTAEVLAICERGLGELRKSFHRPLLRVLPPLRLWLDDAGVALELRVLEGARLVDVTSEQCHLLLSSSAATAAFGNRWGLPTLLISGRFRVTPPGRQAFQRWKSLGALHASGYRTRELPRRLTQQRGREFVTRRWRDVVPQFLAKAT